MNSDEVLLAVSTRLESIDNSLNSVVSVLQEINTNLRSNTQQLATLTEEVFVLREINTSVQSNTQQLAILTEEQKGSFSRLETLIERQHSVCDKQASHIDRLVGIVELLIQQRVA